MRQSLLRASLACLLLTPITAGCVIHPAPGQLGPPAAEVIPADARALVYGRSTAEVLQNPQLQDKLAVLFGADWAPPVPGGKLTLAPPQFFTNGGPLRMVHIGDADYIAITGCATQSCSGYRGLLLIREGGSELMARLDEGGYSHHYHLAGVGPAGSPDRAAMTLDSAVRALARAGGDPYLRPRT